MKEIYIKQPGTDNTRGPLQVDQLEAMATQGSISEDTLVYDEITEKWKPFTAFPELKSQVFPETISLKLSQEEAAPTEQEVADSIAQEKEEPKISAETILAAAEGDTEKTKHIGKIKRSKEKAAELAVPGIATLLIVTGIGLIYPANDLIIKASQLSDWSPVLQLPMIWIGAACLGLAATVFLGVTSVFPIIRIVIAGAGGLMCYLFWAWQNSFLLIAALMMSLGLFIATVSSRQLVMIMSLAIGLIGATIIAYTGVMGYLVY